MCAESTGLSSPSPMSETARAPLTYESTKLSQCFCKLWEIVPYFTSVQRDECRGGLTRPLSTISFCKFVDVITRSLIAWNEGKQVLVFDVDFIEKD